MKISIFWKRFIHTFIAGVLISTQSIQCQTQAADLLQAGLPAANLLINAYMEPFGNSIGVALNKGWFNSAKVHKPLGFDLNLSLNTVMVPNQSKTFNVNELYLKNIKFENSQLNSISPTFFGKKEKGPKAFVMTQNPFAGIPGHSNDTFMTAFNLPPGLGFDFLPIPTLTLNIGLFLNTEFQIRYIPERSFSYDNFKTKLLLNGIGVKHSLKQWFPAIADKKIDFSLQGAFTYFNFRNDFPNALSPDPNSVYSDGSKPSASTYENQHFEYTVEAYTLNLILSRKILMFNLYVAGGYQYSVADFSLNGTYPIVSALADPVNYPKIQTGTKIIKDFRNPVSCSSTYESLTLTGGLRFKVLFFTVFADYTHAKYPVVSAGVGITVR